MADVKSRIAGMPVWADLASGDPEGSRAFYTALFGWEAEVSADPGVGGYTMFKLGGKDVAGLGAVQGQGQPTTWSVYIGTEDAEATARQVEAAGGRVVSPPFDVLEAGRMAVFQDPGGAFISVWQPRAMRGAEVMREPNTIAWVELQTRQLERARGFYAQVFGWQEKLTPMHDGADSYTEWRLDGQGVAGGMVMPPMIPAEVPACWIVYFSVADLESAVARAKSLGGRVQGGIMEYPGGRFAIVDDPQGAVFGLMT